MKKMVCMLTLLGVITVTMFAQSNSPMGGKYDETSSFGEVGNEQLKYWLYKLPSYMTFDDLVVDEERYLP